MKVGFLCCVLGLLLAVVLLAVVGHSLPRQPPTDRAVTEAALEHALWEPPRHMRIAFHYISLIVLLVLHECAHGYAALKLGDDTAKEAGRLTLNPVAHVDVFGSLVLPAILIWSGSSVIFGWAKPVPVNRQKLRNPRTDDMVVSFAGPAVNFLVAGAALVLMLLTLVVTRTLSPGAVSRDLAWVGKAALCNSFADRQVLTVLAFFKSVMFTGIVLGCFNLIPVPPLDGSWILSGLLPGWARGKFEAIRPYGFFLFLALIVTDVFDYVLLIPILFSVGGLTLLFLLAGFG
jgi:Zn-dependent protease